MSKIANLYPPHSHLMPSLGVTPFEFRDEPDLAKVESSDYLTPVK